MISGLIDEYKYPIFYLCNLTNNNGLTNYDNDDE